MIEAKERLHNPITFRKAAVKDAHLIACLDEAAHPLPREEGQLIGNVLKQDLLGEYERDGRNDSFIAYRDNKPIGYMLLAATDPDAQEKEYFIASWSIIPKKRGFRSLTAMMKHALEIGECKASYSAWGRQTTIFESFTHPGMTRWLERQGYEVFVDEREQRDSGGELHCKIRISPKNLNKLKYICDIK